MIARPADGEFAPFYAGYVAAVPDGDPLALLGAELEAARAFYSSIGEARAGQPYAPGKWTPKDVLLHVADTERVMAYRALRAIRDDRTPVPGFDQDEFQRTAGAGARPLASLLDELAAVRAATVALFSSVDAATAARHAVANGAPVTARALLYIVLGHERHHRRSLAAHGLGDANGP